MEQQGTKDTLLTTTDHLMAASYTLDSLMAAYLCLATVNDRILQCVPRGAQNSEFSGLSVGACAPSYPWCLLLEQESRRTQSFIRKYTSFVHRHSHYVTWTWRNEQTFRGDMTLTLNQGRRLRERFFVAHTPCAFGGLYMPEPLP